MDITTESIIELANYFGEDPTVACEGVKEFMGKARDRIKNLCKRIRDFLARVAAWIRGKFASFIKHDVYRIDKELWRKANSVLNDNAYIMMSISRITTYIKPCMDIKPDDKSEKVVNFFEKVDKEIDAWDVKFNALKDSTTYKETIAFVNAEADKTKFSVISAKPLIKIKNSLTETLAKTLEAIGKLDNTNGNINLTSVATASTIFACMTECVNLTIGVINKIESCSVAKPVKETKTEPADKEAK